MRGCNFYPDRLGDYRCVKPLSYPIAKQALKDVAEILGYRDFEEYNFACLVHPYEVEQKLGLL